MTTKELMRAVVGGEIWKRAVDAKNAGNLIGMSFEMGYLKGIADSAEAMGQHAAARIAHNQVRRLEEDFKALT